MSTDAQIDEVYRERSERFGGEARRAAARARRLANARVAAFLAAIAPFLLPLPAGPEMGALRLVLAVFFVAVFGMLVLKHNKADRLRRWYEELVKINNEARTRLARDWDALSPPDDDRPDRSHLVAEQPHLDHTIAAHPYAEDLDIFGHASLIKLLGAVGTPPGRTVLSEWLLAPAEPGVIRARQMAVAGLAPRLDLRDELTARGRLLSNAEAEILEGFLSWAEGEPWLERNRWLVWTAYILPFITLALIALNIAGVLTYHAWAIAVGIALTLTYTIGKNIHAIFDRAFTREAQFRQYSKLFRLISTTSFAAPLLKSIQAELSAGELSAHRQMARLNRLMQLSAARFNLMYLPLQALTLWDVHVLLHLERWQRVAGRHARRWLAALGEVDALAALAGLRHDNPDWVFPDITDQSEPTLKASALGHPLLRRQVRVVNDVQLGPPGTFLMVTGSNMSGKSTLLRAIGINIVLASAGGPVCAFYMRLPPLTLSTDMRVRDSLELGLSHFMAELERLKRVVAAAHEVGQNGRGRLCYLLDDILQGTNTAERQIAARRIIRHLIDTAAIGAVTSHDLALADTEELSSACRPVHFTETLSNGPDGPTLSFDYRLRPGVATSRNALKLLEIVGLDSSGAERAEERQQ